MHDLETTVRDLEATVSASRKKAEHLQGVIGEQEDLLRDLQQAVEQRQARGRAVEEELHALGRKKSKWDQALLGR